MLLNNYSVCRTTLWYFKRYLDILIVLLKISLPISKFFNFSHVFTASFKGIYVFESLKNILKILNILQHIWFKAPFTIEKIPHTIAKCSRKPLFFPVPVLTNFRPSLSVFFVKTQWIRNKPSNFTNFLLYNQMILHKRGNEKVQKNIILSMFEQKLFNLPC